MIEVQQVKMSAMQFKQAAAASVGVVGGMGDHCTLQVSPRGHMQGSQRRGQTWRNQETPWMSGKGCVFGAVA